MESEVNPPCKRRPVSGRALLRRVSSPARTVSTEWVLFVAAAGYQLLCCLPRANIPIDPLCATGIVIQTWRVDKGKTVFVGPGSGPFAGVWLIWKKQAMPRMAGHPDTHTHTCTRTHSRHLQNIYWPSKVPQRGSPRVGKQKVKKQQKKTGSHQFSLRLGSVSMVQTAKSLFKLGFRPIKVSQLSGMREIEFTQYLPGRRCACVALPLSLLVLVPYLHIWYTDAHTVVLHCYRLSSHTLPSPYLSNRPCREASCSTGRLAST